MKLWELGRMFPNVYEKLPADIVWLKVSDKILASGKFFKLISNLFYVK